MKELYAKVLCVKESCVKELRARVDEGACTEVTSMSLSATLATHKRRSDVDVAKCHVCHTEVTSMSPSATPATQSQPRCHQVPRLPHKQRGCHQVSCV